MIEQFKERLDASPLFAESRPHAAGPKSDRVSEVLDVPDTDPATVPESPTRHDRRRKKGGREVEAARI